MKFILTKELGRLARWLRILGYDAEYFESENTGSLIIKALQENRIIITKNLRLGEHRGMELVILKNNSFKQQIKELGEQIKLEFDKNKIFSRCIICNKELLVVEKERLRDKVPYYVFKTQDNFLTCPECRRIYWQGTHWGNVEEVLKSVNSE